MRCVEILVNGQQSWSGYHECYLCMELEEKEQCPESCGCLATKYKIIILQEAFTNESKEEQGSCTRFQAQLLPGINNFLRPLDLEKTHELTVVHLRETSYRRTCAPQC
jgi:hypothetical protein